MPDPFGIDPADEALVEALVAKARPRESRPLPAVVRLREGQVALTPWRYDEDYDLHRAEVMWTKRGLNWATAIASEDGPWRVGAGHQSLASGTAPCLDTAKAAAEAAVARLARGTI